MDQVAVIQSHRVAKKPPKSVFHVNRFGQQIEISRTKNVLQKC